MKRTFVFPTSRLLPAIALISLLLTGCAHYEGLDLAFATQAPQRNRIHIGWCIAEAAEHHEESATILGAILANVEDGLREKKFHVKSPAVAGPLQPTESTNQIAADETLASLIQLHHSALRNTQYHWTEQSPPIASLFHPFKTFEKMTNALEASWKWPPVNITPEELASADGILFWMTEYRCEESETTRKRRKENWVRAPLVIGLGIPLAILGGGMAGVPTEIIKGNTSWMKHSVLLLNAQDGTVLYRNHRFFDGDDARNAKTLRSNIRGLLDHLPNAD